MYGLAARRRDPLSIAVLGVAAVTLFQWLNGDLYSVAWLFWLTLGWADQQDMSDGSDLTDAEGVLVGGASGQDGQSLSRIVTG